MNNSTLMDKPNFVHKPEFAGVLGAIAPHNGWTEPTILDEIQDDVEGEQEALPDLVEGRDEASDDKEPGLALASFTAAVQNVSKGVTERTDAEYKSQMKKCLDFLMDNRLIKDQNGFFSADPQPEAPFLICAWIIHECDTILLDGTPKPPTQVRGTYSHAQKMRAAMTYAFGRIHGLGNLPWHKNSVTGKLEGNPSVSEQVSSYMVSLRRRKVQAGEAATSARAITPELLLKLHNFNKQPKNNTIQDYSPGTRKNYNDTNENNWGGARTRRLLSAAYIIAFLCLLRVDEVLKIQCHHIEFMDTKVKLTLPFRKTHQFGDIKPFYLHMMPPEKAHLCPVRALADWLDVSGINRGYLFRKMASGDRIAERNTPMTSDQFLELFRNNLLDINVDHYPYGTHSFRRGGCQYLAGDLRWPLRRICDWGGWSVEFSNLTIVKYLISWNDDPTEKREDYLNPDRKPTLLCPACGRSCHCA